MKNSIFKRILTVILAFALIASPVAGSLLNFTASAATQSPFVRVSDHESIDYWKGYFSDGQYDSDVWSNTVSTQNAGAVWTDKSVFVPSSAITIDGVTVPVADTGDNFLVSLSVMASNKTVRGYEYIPTSTMLVLDVSGSMGNGNSGNRSWDEMVEAANKAIDTLLNLNENNLVGVVLYSGNTNFGDSDIDHSSVLLPLDRYTTTATNNNGTNDRNDDYPEYLTASNSTVGVNNAVRPRTSGSKSVTGGTYIQGGIYRAMNELIAADAPKVVAEGVQAGMAYTPIMVLMSDGAPTAANLDYDFNGNDVDHETDIGDGGSTDERMGFLTQLTAAYAKARIAEAYEKTPLFYTLGLGLNSLSDNDEAIAEAVLNPSASSGNIRTYWNTYLNLSGNRNTMYLNNNNQNPVVKSDYVTEDFRNYVTQYFEAQASNNVTLEQALLNAFQQIVDMIVLQSVYYPTEIGGGNADLGGHVTFRDDLGEYMDVRSIKGFLFEDTDGHQILHTGAALAKNFVPGGGDLGQTSNPKPLGDELVRSVKERLGIEDTLTAQDLIRNAYYYGQLAYVDENNFSNYIGWYGDADGKFVDFWHEGHTQTEEAAAIAKGAKFIYQSYGYLGEVNEDLGIKASDMMHTAIRVRKTIADDVIGSAVGEIVVEGSIPASLIPTITYEVALNGKTYESGVSSLTITDTSADFPARILYEVGPRADINPINIAEKVNASHKNNDGTYTFYTNDWAFVDIGNNAVADTSINAFTHFEPASENERYYYLTDSVVYADDQGTLYTGATKPSGDGYYHANRVFSVTGGRVSTEITYIKTSPDALSHAERSGNGWVIPAGTGKHEIVGYQVTMKEDNATGTNRFTAYPKIKTDAENPSGEHAHHYSVVTFGNNGKLTVTPATGIKLTKALDAPSTAAQTFEFKIAGANPNEDYTATPVDANGNFGTSTTVRANASGVITVNVAAGASVYVTGLAAGTYTVTESDHSEYRVLTANGNAVNEATVTVTAQQISEALFVNTLKGFGNLYITKAVVGDALPAHATTAGFEITVDLGEALKNTEFDIAHSADPTLTKKTTDGEGKITNLPIKHGETIVIRNVPENTTAVVTEIVYPSNYTPSYSSHNKAGETMDNDNIVTIEKNASATVVVKNAYKPTPTSITVSFDSTKFMNTEQRLAQKTFEFLLDKYENGKWINDQTKTATVTFSGSNTAEVIDFEPLNLTFDKAGVHSYRIYEKQPETPDGITYDPTVYTFVVTVTDVNGQLTATVTGNKVSGSGNTYTVDADFTNSYNTAPVVIDIKKTVVDASKDSVSFAGYEFELYEADAGWQYGAEDLIETDVTDDEGDARFAWQVDSTAVGTHYYVLKEKVPAGYVKPAADALGWHYDIEERKIKVDVTVNNSVVSVQITDEDNNPIDTAFTNIYKTAPATVSLDTVATKTLNGRDMNAGEFTFELSREGTVLAQGKNAAAQDGKAAPITFYKPGTTEKYVLTYEKVGTYHYKLSEKTDNPLGGVDYTTRIFDMVVEVTDNGSGVLSASYYFEDSTTQTVNFVNTYSVKVPTSIQLEATKKLTGGRPMLSSEFHFNMFEMTDDTFAVKKSDTAVATGSNIGAEPDANGVAQATFKFSAIDYTQPGVHYYQISEVDQGNDWGVTFDEAVYNVTVTVTDNLDGTITAAADKTVTELVFTNEYEPTPITQSFVGNKQLTGRPLQAGEFEFALFKATVGQNDVWTVGAQVGQNVTNADNGDIAFPELTFDKAGTYYYIAKEIGGELGGIAYDETQYRITVTVTDNHRGVLSAEAIIVDDEGQLSQILFENEYTTAGAQVILEAQKILTGRDMNEGEFRFVIKEGDTVVAEGANQAAAAGVAADVVFEAIRYTKDDVGQHTYTVEEVVPEGNLKDGVIYDTAKYTVTVTVTDNLDGTLTAVADAPAAEPVFTNKYEPTPITYNFTANKELSGRPIAAGEFEFALFEATVGQNDVWTAGKQIGQNVTNGENGDIVFPKISFTQKGVYHYIVKEIGGALGGVVYDDTQYHIIVTVTDNNLGVLSAEAAIANSDRLDIVFNNIYAAEATGIALKGTKKLSGAVLADKQFTFELYEADDSFVAKGDVLQSVTNTADGTVRFASIRFIKTGTYKYIVVEKNDAQKNYTYDDAVWCVTVEVTDNGEGQLVARTTVNKKGSRENASTFTFENSYVKPDVPKTGDDANIGLWLTLFVLSGVGFASVLLSQKYGKARKRA